MHLKCDTFNWTDTNGIRTQTVTTLNAITTTELLPEAEDENDQNTDVNEKKVTLMKHINSVEKENDKLRQQIHEHDCSQTENDQLKKDNA
ncbi:unnamed protein product, partial [Didymodactylos carnosus]